MKYWIYLPISLFFIGVIVYFSVNNDGEKKANNLKKAHALAQFDTAKIWSATEPLSIKAENEAELIQYRRDLIAHTADYWVPFQPIVDFQNKKKAEKEAKVGPSVLK